MAASAVRVVEGAVHRHVPGHRARGAGHHHGDTGHDGQPEVALPARPIVPRRSSASTRHLASALARWTRSASTWVTRSKSSPTRATSV